MLVSVRMTIEKGKNCNRRNRITEMSLHTIDMAFTIGLGRGDRHTMGKRIK